MAEASVREPMRILARRLTPDRSRLAHRPREDGAPPDAVVADGPRPARFATLSLQWSCVTSTPQGVPSPELHAGRAPARRDANSTHGIPSSHVAKPHDGGYGTAVKAPDCGSGRGFCACPSSSRPARETAAQAQTAARNKTPSMRRRPTGDDRAQGGQRCRPEPGARRRRLAQGHLARRFHRANNRPEAPPKKYSSPLTAAARVVSLPKHLLLITPS